MPHIPLLRNLISRQQQQHDPGRFLLAILLVFVASNGGTPGHVPHLPRQLLMEIKSYLTYQALDCIMISPMKSREMVIAIEVLAVYDPLLGHSISTRPQTSWFVVPTSFYLELALGFTYRIGIVDNVKKLKEWFAEKQRQREDGDIEDAPLPNGIAALLLDATIWVSLELHMAELCRNLQGVTNCFARDWQRMWPDAEEDGDRASFGEIVRLCTRHWSTDPSQGGAKQCGSTKTKAMSPSSEFAANSLPLGSKLGLVNLAFRQDGLKLLREVLLELYDGTPSVSRIDANYIRLEDSLSTPLKDFASESHRFISKSLEPGSKGTELVSLCDQVFERELAWMKHFYGGYCFAILLWVPKLSKKGAR